jgi:methyltransferase (TIGR00027 family)
VTAAVVASTLLLLRDDPELRHLVDPACLAPLELAVRRTVPLLGYLIDRVPWPVLMRVARVAEGSLSPGFVTHYALRKRAVRDALLGAMGDGFLQVVLVGAGFDMLSESIPGPARVFEVDHPATQQAKREALRGIATREVDFVPLDLAVESLREALLAAPGFDEDASTVYVAEGLLMYLAPSRVDALLTDMNGPARTRAIVSVITPDSSGRYRLHTQRRAVDWCMRLLDEPFVWGERRAAVGALLKRLGLREVDAVSTFELRVQLLPPAARTRLSRATGEIVVVAESARTSLSSHSRKDHQGGLVRSADTAEERL